VAVNVIRYGPMHRAGTRTESHVMKQIADETGGRCGRGRRNEALAEGIEDSRATYTLGFYLAEGTATTGSTRYR